MKRPLSRTPSVPGTLLLVPSGPHFGDGWSKLLPRQESLKLVSKFHADIAAFAVEVFNDGPCYPLEGCIISLVLYPVYRRWQLLFLGSGIMRDFLFSQMTVLYFSASYTSTNKCTLLHGKREGSNTIPRISLLLGIAGIFSLPSTSTAILGSPGECGESSEGCLVLAKQF